MLELILFIAIIVLDQVSKALCAVWLPSLPNQAFPLIDGVFELAYVENRGAAFGMLQNARWLLIALTVIVCGAMIWFLIKKTERPSWNVACMHRADRRGCGWKFDRPAVFRICAGYVLFLVDQLRRIQCCGCIHYHRRNPSCDRPFVIQKRKGIFRTTGSKETPGNAREAQRMRPYNGGAYARAG